VGIDEVPGLKGLIVFPNPVDDDLLMEFDLLEQQDIFVQIFNTTGQLVSSNEFENTSQGQNQLSIKDLNHLAKGIYFVKINVGDQFLLKKIIKR
jgi:hypothetical protein